jgi:hypothetical protein
MANISGSNRFNISSFLRHLLISIAALASFGANADEFPRWAESITKYNESQVMDFHPMFDFDSDGCYPATPFYPDASLRQNPGLNATGTVWGACRDAGFELTSNTTHRQLCKESTEGLDKVVRCAHLYELYFEKDQAVGFSFLGGHRHDVETVIVWTGQRNDQPAFISQVSVSAHGKYTTRPFAGLVADGTHPLVVYNKNSILTHTFRFANAGDKLHVEYLGNSGSFYTPNILSHFSAVAQWNDDEWTRYLLNKQYRTALANSDFGSATFKTRTDAIVLNEVNNNIPGGDAFWAGVSFTWDDVWLTTTKEFQANYPDVYQQISE